MSFPRIRIGFRWLLVPTAFSLSIPAPARAAVADVALKDLVARSVSPENRRIVDAHRPTASRGRSIDSPGAV